MVRVRLPLLYRGCPRLPTVALRKPASAAPSSPLRRPFAALPAIGSSGSLAAELGCGSGAGDARC